MDSIIEYTTEPSNQEIYDELQEVKKKLDVILMRIDKHEEERSTEGPLERPSDFRRIRTPNDLSSFEQRLEDEGYKSSLMKIVKSKYENSTKYRNSSRRFAYKVIDLFSKRKLFSSFSWTGKARNGQKYMALEKHTRFFNFLLDAIKIKMKNFDSNDLEDILQGLCRNKKSARSESSDS